MATDGPGLTFIAYPQAVTILPWAPVWSALFFLMLIILALSTMFPTVENIATALVDQWPRHLRPYSFWVVLALCALFFLLGLPLTTGGGMYLLQLLDTYGVGYALLFLGLVEVAVVSWRYGADRLLDNLKVLVFYRMISNNSPVNYYRYISMTSESFDRPPASLINSYHSCNL